MRRILITTDAVGGVWQYSVELAHGLSRLGWTCVLAVLGPEPSAVQRRQAGAVDLVVGNVALDWTARSAEELDDAAAWIAGIARARGVDSVHLHAPALMRTAPWPAPVVAVAHSCVATWWRAVHGGVLPEDLVWRRDATDAGLRMAGAVISPSRAFAHDLARVYPNAPPARVVHNGRGMVPVTSSGRQRIVLAAGRLWDLAKNMRTLDAAAAALDAPVHAAGPLHGLQGERFEPGHLRTLGNLSEQDLHRAMSGATVFASPSLYEPFGLAVLEAAAHGMALVLSDIPTFRELWDGAALFVRRDDAAAWARALRTALDDPHRLMQAALDRARAFPAESMVRGVAEIHLDAGAAPPRAVTAPRSAA